MPRSVDLVVLSDIHLGTRSCRAEDLERYLDSISPRRLVLNGDIVDVREWGKGWWPAAHTRVVERFLALAAGDCEVSYVTGNHDALLRLISDRRIAGLHLVDRLELDLAGRRTLFTHGDRIEHSLPINRIVRRVACHGYHALRGIDRVVNAALRPLTDRRLGLLRATKHLGRAHLDRYDHACARAAAEGGYDAVVVGHIHRPRVANLDVDGRSVLYVNSGDWVGHATALEHEERAGWRIVHADREPEPATADLDRPAFG